jgi:hypothetical protein
MLKRVVCVPIVAALVFLAAPAESASVTGIGPRFGFSLDPDQLVLGGQLLIGEVAPNMTFDPNLEFGFGDNVTVIGLGLDLHYHFKLTNSEWRPYLGAGVGIHFYDQDVQPPASDNTSTEVGGNIILGVGVPTGGSRFFTEMKLGVGDIPSLKMVAGWNFRM